MVYNHITVVSIQFSVVMSCQLTCMRLQRAAQHHSDSLEVLEELREGLVILLRLSVSVDHHIRHFE